MAVANVPIRPATGVRSSKGAAPALAARLSALQSHFTSKLPSPEQSRDYPVKLPMPLSLVFLQLATAQVPATLPDIELNARVRAREAVVRSSGEARLTLSVEPGDAPPVQVSRSAPAGAERYRNLTIDLRATARIADPESSQQGKTDEDTSP